MIQVRINGKGNAWPVILGQDHPFYDRSKPEEIANASCSILKTNHINPMVNNIEWEFMIDAGHGAVQFLLKNSNRIPDALFLTHPHIDHTLGIDWIIQSYFKTCKKKYPVYATALCWEQTLMSFPHLKSLVQFNELLPYQEYELNQDNHLTVTPIPVYHGESAVGATMLYFTYSDQIETKRILFSGDILCPILREQDFEFLSKLDLFVADANNRYPYPKSNHWSVLNGLNHAESSLLTEFKKDVTIAKILYPHIHNSSLSYSRCFDYFFNRQERIDQIILSIVDFVSILKPVKTVLLHYSGTEDEAYYNKKRLTNHELKQWLMQLEIDYNLESKLIVPDVGQCFVL